MKSNALRIVSATHTDGAGETVEMTNLKASLRLFNKGRIEGYAQALMDSGPVPPTPEKRDEWLANYRARAAKKYPMAQEG